MKTLNFLSIEQMQTLRDLGLEMKITPYAYYKTRKEGEWEIKADNDNTFPAYEYYEKLPIYGLENLIDTLPNNVWIDEKHLYLNIDKRVYDWCVGYHSNTMKNNGNVIEKSDKEMLNALYKMVVYLIKEGIIETSKIQKFDIEKAKCLNSESIEKNLKPFNLDAAKQGKPVCTRDGCKARIICFDRKDNTPIVALIERVDDIEILQCYHNDGKCFHYETSNNDLMMFPEKKEGWILLQKDGYTFDNEEAAKKICTDEQFVAKVEWEE